jgi:two-component sensor histidine kinase
MAGAQTSETGVTDDSGLGVGSMTSRILIPFVEVKDAQTLAQAIVNTLHEPFLVLDADLRVLSASPSFYGAFKVEPGQTIGRLLYDLGDGQWDIPALRVPLETIIPERTAMDAFEVSHDFPTLGRRIMLLNARKVLYETSADTTILLAFTDVTARRAIEHEKDQLLARTEELLRQKNVLMQEMGHRVANSLQIIASLLMLKARSVASEETRGHLRDAHQRVMSVATLQDHIHAAEGVETIALGDYLAPLCASLAETMVDERQPIAVTVVAEGDPAPSAQALSLGLIVTELLINAIKYAFPQPRDDAAIHIAYLRGPDGWTLVVSDNGVGKTPGVTSRSGGLGTVIIQALVGQLGGVMEERSGGEGLTVSITGG